MWTIPYALFRRAWAFEDQRPQTLPMFSNVIQLVSTNTQYYYDVWAAWMPREMPLVGYVTVPSQDRNSIWIGSFTLLQILFYLWPLVVPMTSE